MQFAKNCGLLNAWRDVWPEDFMELDEEDDFITKFNSLARFFSVPKTFAEPLLEKIYDEPEAKNNQTYQDLGHYRRN